MILEQARASEGIQDRIEMVMEEEFREREARRLNLVIHGMTEPDDSIKDPGERMERDKEECEKIFIAMNARQRYQQIRFCRRIGEKGGDPRPIVMGVYSEEEKRHLLDRAKQLKYSRYENVTLVPDLTKNQRKGEQKLRNEVGRRNTQLTAEDRERNLRWIVVGKRGEKRLIKGTERENQSGRQERWNMGDWTRRDTGGGFRGNYRGGDSNNGTNSDRGGCGDGYNNERNNGNGSETHNNNGGGFRGGDSGNSNNRGGGSGGYNRGNGVGSFSNHGERASRGGDRGGYERRNRTESYSNNGGGASRYGGVYDRGNGGDNGRSNSGGGTGRGDGGGGGRRYDRGNGGQSYSYNGGGANRGGGGGGGWRQPENRWNGDRDLGARPKTGGVWDRQQENRNTREMDMLERQPGGIHEVEDWLIRPPQLLEPRRPDLTRDQNSSTRDRLSSNKRGRSQGGGEEDEEETEQDKDYNLARRMRQ